MTKILYYGMAAFYAFAGVNHFIDPQFYLDLIPPYLPFPEFINIFSGLIEIIFAIMLLFDRYRKLASQLIIAMLIAFIPSHVYFIQIGFCIDGGLCTEEWIGWVRLVVIHPVLIYWAYWVGYNDQKSGK